VQPRLRTRPALTPSRGQSCTSLAPADRCATRCPAVRRPGRVPTPSYLRTTTNCRRLRQLRLRRCSRLVETGPASAWHCFSPSRLVTLYPGVPPRLVARLDYCHAADLPRLAYYDHRCTSYGEECVAVAVRDACPCVAQLASDDAQTGRLTVRRYAYSFRTDHSSQCAVIGLYQRWS